MHPKLFKILSFKYLNFNTEFRSIIQHLQGLGLCTFMFLCFYLFILFFSSDEFELPYICTTHFTCSLTNFLGLEIRSKLVQNILSINCAIKFQLYHLVHVRIPSIFSILYLQVFSQLKYKVAR